MDLIACPIARLPDACPIIRSPDRPIVDATITVHH
jgi:hypothetical protein